MAASSSGDRLPRRKPVLLVGFHGYAETAEIQIERLAALSWRGRLDAPLGAGASPLLSRPFGGSGLVVDDATGSGRRPSPTTSGTSMRRSPRFRRRPLRTILVVYAGFSQGVAMAFRAAVLGRWPCAGVVAVGGDVPPELLEDRSLAVPGCPHAPRNQGRVVHARHASRRMSRA